MTKIEYHLLDGCGCVVKIFDITLVQPTSVHADTITLFIFILFNENLKKKHLNIPIAR